MAIVITKPEKAFSHKRALVKELLCLLQIDAKKNEMVERLIKERDIAVKESYTFTYGVTKWDINEFDYCARPEDVVAEIIALKERYEKQIRRCRVKHERFNTIIKQLPYNEAETLLKAFCTSIEVDEQDVKRIIGKHLYLIKSHYPED